MFDLNCGLGCIRAYTMAKLIEYTYNGCVYYNTCVNYPLKLVLKGKKKKDSS